MAFFADVYRQLQEDQTMNAKQGGLSPTGNVDFGVTNVGAALEIFSMSASDDSTTFAKLVETNASLIRQLKESLGKK